ncbi:UPF0047 protein YjbQ-like [Haliotis asinina]|uniref:UPF0047 protein YjbQ-like n=1 Tax=Haliotis asinina TaxID=109174 RepID=UPI003531F3AE
MAFGGSHMFIRESRRFTALFRSFNMAAGGPSVWYQKEVTIPAKKRGCHLISDDIVKQFPEIKKISVGLLHIHIKHTSASVALNENWDPDVRVDMEMMLNKIVPEGAGYLHSCEGPDDMPAHVKAALIGSSVTVPITDGRMNMGTWQGVWLCEHRNRAGSRHLVATLQGAAKQ